MTVDEVYEQWIVDKAMVVKRSTVSTYQLLYNNRLKVVFGTIDAESIDRLMVKKTVQEFLASGMSSKYIKDMLIVLKMILQYGEEEFDLRILSTEWHIKYPTEAITANKIESYTPAEIEKIFRYLFDNPCPRNLGLLVALSSGMRIGEVCALQFRDVDFDNKTIEVNSTIERIWIGDDTHKTEVIFGAPKTASSNRAIPVVGEVMSMLKKYSKVTKPEYFICSCDKKFVEPRVFRNYYKLVVGKVLGKDRILKFHALRHTYATHLISSGIDVKTVSPLLGHADVSTTLNIYTHPTLDQKKGAVNKAFVKFMRKAKKENSDDPF